MARTRVTCGGRVIRYCGCDVNYPLGSDPSNAVPTTSQDSSAVADNPVLDETAMTSANLGVCHTNADKASEQSEAQKTDSGQHGVDMAETSRLEKEDVPSQPTNFSTTNISLSSSTLPNNPPYSDLQAMLKFMKEQEKKDRKELKARDERKRREQREREREREAKEERQRKERESKEEKDRKESEDRESERRKRLMMKFLIEKEERKSKEHEERRKESERRTGSPKNEFIERIEKEDKEFLERMKRKYGVENTEKKTVTTTTSEIKSEPEIKMEESTVSEKVSELESFQSDLDSKDSPWDGPQDNVLVRDMAIDSAVNEYVEIVCCEAMDAFTSLDDSLDSNLTLVGGKKSTPEPERRLDATMSENPSASDPSWIFKSPELGERTGNPECKSHIGEVQLCDDFLRYSFPMVFSAKNRSVTVTKIGVVQFLGENTASFSAIQCFIPYNDNGYGLCYDSVRSVSSCGSCRERKPGSVWSSSSRDANEVFRIVKSENLRRKAGNQYYPVSTAAQWSMKLKLAKRTLKFTPMVWSLVSKCSRYIAIGVYRSSIAMFPEYLTQPPGCQRVVIWSFKLEFGIT